MKLIISFLLLFILNEMVIAQQPQGENQNAPTEQRRRTEVTWVNSELNGNSGLEHCILLSKNLGHEVGYVVWTPPGYNEKSKKRSPVIYFLHGAGGNESKDAAGFSEWVKKAINEGIIPPVICVFPNGGMSGYRGEVEKMIIEELIPEIDRTYRTIAKPKGRLLAGFSMGGAGSVYLAIHHPGVFSGAGSMGGGLRNNNDELAHAISVAIPVWKKNKFRFFMVNGDNDRPEAFTDFSDLLNKEGIANKVVILPDTKHNLGLYYEHSVIQLISFIAENLK